MVTPEVFPLSFAFSHMPSGPGDPRRMAKPGASVARHAKSCPVCGLSDGPCGYAAPEAAGAMVMDGPMGCPTGVACPFRAGSEDSMSDKGLSEALKLQLITRLYLAFSSLLVLAVFLRLGMP